MYQESATLPLLPEAEVALEFVDSVQVGYERALSYLVSMANEAGFYPGLPDTGPMITAASLIFSRSVNKDLSHDDEQLELELLANVLSHQVESGGFRLYPDGPVSHDSTRIAILAMRRVLQANTLIRDDADPDLGSEIDRALAAALLFVSSPTPPDTQDTFSSRAIRKVLEYIDHKTEAGQGSTEFGWFSRLLLNRRVLPSGWLLKILDSPLRDKVDTYIYPFLPEILPLAIILRHLRVIRAEIPKPQDITPDRTLEALVNTALQVQDVSGGIFYVSILTEFFRYVMASTLEQAGGRLTPAAVSQITESINRAEKFLRESIGEAAVGKSVACFKLNVWNTACALKIMIGDKDCRQSPETILPGIRYLLDHQTQAGGWAFTEGSQQTDTDDAGFVLSLLAQVRKLNLLPDLNETIDTAMIKAVDYCLSMQGKTGGFAWEKSGFTKNRVAFDPASIRSIFSYPDEDITGRVLEALGNIKTLIYSHPDIAKKFGQERYFRIEKAGKLAFNFLARSQQTNGLWHGRWMLGFIPGTFFAMKGLKAWNPRAFPSLSRRAVDTLIRAQNSDGGFGESAKSDITGEFSPSDTSTSVQTALALLILLESGVPLTHDSCTRALTFILSRQRPDGSFPPASVCTMGDHYYKLNIGDQSLVTLALQRALSSATEPRLF